MALSAALPPNWPPTAGLLRHHDHSLADRLDRAGARGARASCLALREEDFVLAAQARRRQRAARDHSTIWCPAFMSYIIVGADARDPRDDPGRDRAELPGPRAAPAGDQLGRAAPGGPECPDARAAALADAARRRSFLSPCWPSTSWAMACATPPIRIPRDSEIGDYELS